MNIVQTIYDGLVAIGFSEETAKILDQLVAFVGVLLVAYLADTICRKILLNIVGRIIKRTKVSWDDVVFDRSVMIHLSRMVAPIIIYVLIPATFIEFSATTVDFVHRLCWVFVVFMFVRFLSALLEAVYSVIHKKEQYRQRPLKGILQTVQIILYSLTAIYIVSQLLNKDFTAIFAALGASAAILMLVFKDSIMGFVSGIQLSTNNMLRVGDWIVMNKYGADGTVIEVTLNTVKVQNWDNTIVTIPPYSLMSDSFQNWRGMEESPGRRIKRSINIDMNSIHFCTPEMLAKYRKIHLLSNYVDQKEQVVKEYNDHHHVDNSVLVNGRRQTNLGVFRAYLNNYLKNHPSVRHDMTCMVRQLQPTQTGIPIELYFFSAIKEWVPYEGLQADVFDHVLAIIPEFDLRVYQSPSGADFREYNSAKEG
ncbi:MAG: mechanosensitive ion channel family protein [Prevotellaceae bacterium]|jgi:miniconductance mechanosensitive channel|nr:mechanosensitive ion channel family protein [Prevotellaceae bacterium]